ncbi:hypothetical protein GCM10010425_17660 [Streptomyces spororaveus]|uniref:Uncharacterized protein n=1 Tax=Streptomyces spororaveus TaxID=284039 RepID=A0ABQ3T9Z1_9ACTN|nr:hypothetical protein Sspor_27870 [Streptomyces spororaveus]
MVVGDVNRPAGEIGYEVLCRRHHRRRMTSAAAQAGAPTEWVTPDGRVTRQHRTTLWGTDLPMPPGSATIDCPLRFPGRYHAEAVP